MIPEPIFVNARFLTQKISGVQRFAIELSKRLIQKIPEITFVAPPNILHKELAAELKVQRFGRFTGHLWEQLDLPLYLKKRGRPLLINFTNTGPLFYDRSVITIHDLAVWDFPSSYSFSFKLLYRFLLPKLAKNSVALVTVSQFSKKRIKQKFGVDSFVINNAVSELFSATPYTVKKKFILAVSSLDPKKNFSNLFKAFQISDLNDYSLLIVGGKNTVFKDTSILKTIENDKRIQFTGYISDQELAKLYSTATLFVYPSLYEGFGIPPLEAMYSGCPTLVSSIPSLIETCGNAVMYANPYSPQDIAKKMNIICSSPKVQSDLSIKGYSHSSKYSWETSTLNFIKIIKDVMKAN